MTGRGDIVRSELAGLSESVRSSSQETKVELNRVKDWQTDCAWIFREPANSLSMHRRSRSSSTYNSAISMRP